MGKWVGAGAPRELNLYENGLCCRSSRLSIRSGPAASPGRPSPRCQDKGAKGEGEHAPQLYLDETEDVQYLRVVA